MLERGGKVPIRQILGWVTGRFRPTAGYLVCRSLRICEGRFQPRPSEVDARIADSGAIPVNECDNGVVIPKGVPMMEIAMDQCMCIVYRLNTRPDVVRGFQQRRGRRPAFLSVGDERVVPYRPVDMRKAMVGR